MDGHTTTPPALPTEQTVPVAAGETVSATANGNGSLWRRPSPLPSAAEEESVQRSHSATPQAMDHEPPSIERNDPTTVISRDDDVNSEAETLIDSPVKRREVAKASANANGNGNGNGNADPGLVVKTERPAKSRIGSLPVPGDDDDEDESIATPMQSTEISDAKATPNADMLKHSGDDMDLGSDKENSSRSLSSAQSLASNPASRASSVTRALSERLEFARIGVEPSNSRKRKHRASSVSLPRKRLSMEPPKNAPRGTYSEDTPATRLHHSPSPRMRNHRRTVSTQNTSVDGSADSAAGKRRAATQFPVRDPKPIKPGWEESDASSETNSHGYTDLRRPQRGVGRSTSTPGRPQGRELKRHVNKYGFTRLAEACEAGDLVMVKEWRERDPDAVEIAEFAGNKPLQIAALNGNDEVVAYLIDQGCQIDCANVDKDTPLIDAAENGHLEVVKILLNAGVDPLRQNLKGQRALDVAIEDTDDADEIRTALRQAIESWNRSAAKQRREEEEEQRHRAGPSKELHFMARSYENLLRLVTINDRTGVREFLDARVPVDNGIIAAAAKTGDQYLVNMLMAEMSEKKRTAKAEKPMLAVLGTSHFDMVELLAGLDHFKPLHQSRSGKTWPEVAEERNGPNCRQEKELLQRLYHECVLKRRIEGRGSSSPVTKREGSKRRGLQADSAEEESSDEMESRAPKGKRKNGRRLMSRRDMRAASGKGLEESEESEGGDGASNSDAYAAADDADGVRRRRMEMRASGSPDRKHGLDKPPMKRRPSMSVAASSPNARRRTSSLREPALPTVEEKVERREDGADVGGQRAAEALFAIQEAQRLQAKWQDEEATKAEVKRVEAEEAQKAEEERQAEAERLHAEAERLRHREEEEEARRLEQVRVEAEAQAERVRLEAEARAEQARMEAEARRAEEMESERARLDHVLNLLASLPTTLKQALEPTSAFTYRGSTALGRLEEHFTPLLAVRESEQGAWVLNLQAAPLLGKRGLKLLHSRDNTLGFESTFSEGWERYSEMTAQESRNVREVIARLTTNEAANAEENRAEDDETDDFSSELQCTADRLNATYAVQTRLLGSEYLDLYCVRLDDVLAHLDPVLQDAVIDVRSLGPPLHTQFVATALTGQGVEDFAARMQAFWGQISVVQRLRGGMVEGGGRGMGLGTTGVVVVHEK